LGDQSLWLKGSGGKNKHLCLL